MKIGLFSDTYLPDINGVVTSIETLRHGLIELGHEVYIIANHSSLLTLKYEDNILVRLQSFWSNELQSIRYY